MTLLIQVPQSFHHAGQIPAGLIGDDPRFTTPSDRVVVDLRYCDFVRPPAAMWCLIYPLLVARQGQTCIVTVPENVGVARYLKTINLFDLLLENGVEVDDRGITPTRDEHIGVRLEHFDTEAKVEQIANRSLEEMTDRDLGAGNIRSVVVETFSELAFNAVQHSESPIGAFGMVQLYEWESNDCFICVVSDAGIGIRKSLEKNPELRERIFYDWSAIDLALQERVSGTGVPTRGIGLHAIAEDMRRPGRTLIIHSGIGIVTQNEESEREARRGPPFPGTLASASIVT